MFRYSQFDDPARQELVGHLRVLVGGQITRRSLLEGRHTSIYPLVPGTNVRRKCEYFEF